MPKKITIVSGAALVLLAAIVAVLLSVTENRSTSAVPRRVSVYIPERSEILTMTYADFLAGCVTGLTGGENLADEALAAVAAAENSRAMYELSTKKGKVGCHKWGTVMWKK